MRVEAATIAATQIRRRVDRCGDKVTIFDIGWGNIKDRKTGCNSAKAYVNSFRGNVPMPGIEQAGPVETIFYDRAFPCISVHRFFGVTLSRPQWKV